VFVNVFTGGANDDPAWLVHSRWLLTEGQEGRLTIVTSPIVVAEVMGNGGVRGAHVPVRDRSERVRAVHGYFRDNDLEWVEIDRVLGFSAADICVDHQLKGADALHVAAAVRARVDRVVSWDRDLLKLAGSDLGVDFAEPHMVGQMSFET
jgi:predicted nucleic acid-binding protein